MVFKPKNPPKPETEVLEAPETEGAMDAPAVSEPEEKGSDGFKTRLTEGAKRTVTEQARAKVQQEIIKQEKDKFFQEEVERLRAEAGISRPGLGGIHDELVDIVMDLGYEGSANIQINHGKRYWHGMTYRVPRHVASVLLDIMWNNVKLSRHVKGEKVWGRSTSYSSTLSAKPVGQSSQENVH